MAQDNRFDPARLDRIYATQDGNIVNAWTDPKACAYSDHLPVFADIAFRDWPEIRRKLGSTEANRSALAAKSEFSLNVLKCLQRRSSHDD